MAASTALIPIDNRQQCAMAAIAIVESKIDSGKKLSEYPYAKAFFREITGASSISSKDIRLVDLAYNPALRGGSTKVDYIRAINAAIESRGEVWILPLSSDVLIAMFPSILNKQSQRKNCRTTIKRERELRLDEQKKREQICASENAKRSAWIVLQFLLPGQHKKWLADWRDVLIAADVRESEIKAMLIRWWSGFWIASIRNDWLWCDSMYELLNELDYVVETSSPYELFLCRSAVPFALPDLTANS